MMSVVKKLQLVKNSDIDGNGQGTVEGENEVIENEEMDIEILDDEQEEVGVTARTIARMLPTDVTLIVQNNSYTLEVLESYKHIISEEMRAILQKEGHRSPNFRRYGEILRNITTAIKLKTDFIRDLFRKLVKTAPEELAKTSYATIVHYQKSLCDYQEIVTYKQARLNQELKVLKEVLGKLDTTFVVLRKRAKEISELISSITDEEIASYPPQELEEFRAILESALDEKGGEQSQTRMTSRQSLLKVLEAIGIQALSFKENRKYQEILSDIEWYLGNEKAAFVTTILNRFSDLTPREVARKYDTTIIKHHLFLLSHFTLLLDSQDNLQIIEHYNEISRRLSEALNIKLNPYKAQLGLRICDDLAGIYSDELAAYQTFERIQEYRKILESSIAASEDEEDAPDLLIRRKTLVKVLEAEGIQTLMWEDPEKHKKYQETLAHIEQNLVPFKEEFLKERLERFSGLSPQTIAQKYRVNTIKHNVLLLSRLSLLLNRQENVDLMYDYYKVSKNIFEALNLKLEETKLQQEDSNEFRKDAKAVLLESDLFRTLSNTALERIVDNVMLIKKEKESVIIQKGQKGDAFYVINKGSVKVSLPSKGGKEIHIATLTKSDCFGEMSLLTGNPASATIKCLEDVELLKLSEEHFNDMLLEYPVLNRYFHRILSERLRDASTQTKDGELQKGLTGKLSTISLEELIQTLYTANKTGVLTVDNNGDKGKIFIKNGLVIHAMTKSLKGEQAFFRMMTWHDATFRFIPGEVNVERTVTMNVHGLLLEAMKRIDDMRQIKHL
jgi:CRP-like cAMP-binding protein